MKRGDMGKKSNAAAEASPTRRRARRKRGLLRRSLGKLVLVGMVSAVAKFFADSSKGGDRRKKVMGMVGK